MIAGASDMPAAERLAWLRLARTESVGPITFFRLVDRYGTATRALDALPDLARRGGRARPLVAASMDSVAREHDALIKAGGQLLLACDPAYPIGLGAIEDAPPVLSAMGDLALLQRQSIAIVGARNASLNGRKFASLLAGDLGRAGLVVTSGLARGIDTAAHEGALATGTIAVVAGGIDIVYPPENQALYDRIRASGLILAESALGQQPFAQSFPRRNRIVSGVSTGVVVVEATERSGSLITARMAGEQGRDVYAVPGHPLDPRASGPNRLIRDGAMLVRDAADIVESLGSYHGWQALEDGSRLQSLYVPAAANDEVTEVQARQEVEQVLSLTPVSVDDLVRETGLSAASVQMALLELELAGRVQRLPGNRTVLMG